MSTSRPIWHLRIMALLVSVILAGACSTLSPLNARLVPSPPPAKTVSLVDSAPRNPCLVPLEVPARVAPAPTAPEEAVRSIHLGRPRVCVLLSQGGGVPSAELAALEHRVDMRTQLETLLHRTGRFEVEMLEAEGSATPSCALLVKGTLVSLFARKFNRVYGASYDPLVSFDLKIWDQQANVLAWSGQATGSLTQAELEEFRVRTVITDPDGVAPPLGGGDENVLDACAEAVNRALHRVVAEINLWFPRRGYVQDGWTQQGQRRVRISLGYANGVREGQVYVLALTEDALSDPRTGGALESRRLPCAVVQVSSVWPAHAEALVLRSADDETCTGGFVNAEALEVVGEHDRVTASCGTDPQSEAR